MISKIIPPETRGTFFGLQAGLANLFISGSAIAAGYLLNYLDSPLNFAACFLLASIFFALSWIALAQTREPEDTEKIIPEEKTHFWDECKKNIAQGCKLQLVPRAFDSSRNSPPWDSRSTSFTPCVDFNMDTVTAGFLTATLTISQTIANIGMGRIGDRIGHRAMLILGAFAALLSAILAWNATSILWFYPIFILTGLANVSIWTIGMVNDCGLRQRNRTSDVHWSLANTHRPRHHPRSPARRLDRGLGRFHSNIFNIDHHLNGNDRHSFIFSERSANDQQQTIDNGRWTIVLVFHGLLSIAYFRS